MAKYQMIIKIRVEDDDNFPIDEMKKYLEQDFIKMKLYKITDTPDENEEYEYIITSFDKQQLESLMKYIKFFGYKQVNDLVLMDFWHNYYNNNGKLEKKDFIFPDDF